MLSATQIQRCGVMTTFEEFWKEYEESSDLLSLEGLARWAWEEAVLAERERLEKIVFSERKFIEENYCEILGEIGQYYGGRLDAYDNVLYAIRNP